MNLMQISYLIIVFCFIAGITFVIIRVFSGSSTQKRLEEINVVPDGTQIETDGDGYDQWEQSISKIVKPFASLSLPSEGWEKSNLRSRFMQAGYRAQSLPFFYFGSKTVLAIILPGALLLTIGMTSLEIAPQIMWMVLLLMATIGYYLPNFILARKIFVRKRDIFEYFPDAIDLMTVCVEAGLGLDAAMSKVGEEMHVSCMALAEEINLVNLEMRAGRSREQALRNLAKRTGVEEIDGLVSMLIQADRFGTSIAVSLRVHSDMLRTKRRLRAEEAAGKIALKLLFPLIFFLFPALMVVIIGPGAITIIRTLLPGIAGQ
jgi:tight adherence protein C